MKNVTIAATIFSLNLLLTAIVFSQNEVLDLNGFRLGQYRSTTYQELGDPGQEGMSGNNIPFEAFWLKDDPPLYMVFEYDPDADSIIHSIQMTGSDPNIETGVLGLRFGMTEAQVTKILGTPSGRRDVGEYGTLWTFDKANYSIEINKNGRLSSIRIWTPSQTENGPDVKKLPDTKSFLTNLANGTNSEIAELLAPDMEVYVDGKTTYFTRRLRNEIINDTSKIFSTIRDLSKPLLSLNLSSKNVEVNARLRSGRDPLHVIKFKNAGKVKELVFQWYAGKWRLWEFDAGRPAREPNIDRSRFRPDTFRNFDEVHQGSLVQTPNLTLSNADKSPRLYISYIGIASKIDATFTGDAKPITERKAELLKVWTQSTGRDNEVVGMFKTEYRFTEKGKDYWLLVDNILEDKLKNQIGKNGKATLFTVWLGFVADSKENVFLVLDVDPHASPVPPDANRQANIETRR